MQLSTLVRTMQVSSLLLFLLGIYMAYYMSAVQSPVLFPAYGAYFDSLGKLEEKIDALGSSGTNLNEMATAVAKTQILHGQLLAAEGDRADARYAHAHANLLALWTVVASLLLFRLQVPLWLAIGSGTSFIVGSWTHAGIFALRELGIPGLTPFMRLEIAEKVLLLGIVLLLMAVVWDWIRKQQVETK